MQAKITLSHKIESNGRDWLPPQRAEYGPGGVANSGPGLGCGLGVGRMHNIGSFVRRVLPEAQLANARKKQKPAVLGRWAVLMVLKYQI